MRLRSLLFLPLIYLVFLSISCEQVSERVKKLTATRVKDILDHPRNYENKEITIYGTVTGGASLLVVKYFEIEDDTGTIKVMTKGYPRASQGGDNKAGSGAGVVEPGKRGKARWGEVGNRS
ncbi:MAG: hypothetical protein HYT78_07070 [Deltaproteobacteria bacterium]|nr:hypothetical protein [Deltaproteobacteria bacterium]